MTILWCGGEDIDFPDSDFGTPTTSSSYYRSGYSRCALNGTAPYYHYARSPVLAPFSSVWLSGYVYCLNHYNSDTVMLFCLVNSEEDAYIGWGNYGGEDQGKVCLMKYDGSTYTLLATETGTSFYPSGVLTKVDIQIVNYGPSGTARIYVNGSKVVEYTGDIAVNSQTTLDQIFIQGSGYAADTSPYWSEIILSDTDTRLMSLKTLAPNAAGDANEWDSGSYTDIDEVVLSDVDVISTEGVGDNFQCNLTGMPTGSYKIKAVRMVASAADDQAQMGLKIGVKTNSAVHLGGAHSLTGSWKTYEKIFHDNPETASVFTSGEIDSLQLALRTDSTTTTTTTV